MWRNNGAILSADRKHRYSLWRIWDSNLPLILIIGLNGSTADEYTDDPTVIRCVYRAMREGFGGLLMGNLHGYRTLDPHKLMQAADPVGRDNDKYLRELINKASLRVCAWGNYGNFMGRADIVLKMVPDPYCLGLTKRGQPIHPLYVPYSQSFIKFNKEVAHSSPA